MTWKEFCKKANEIQLRIFDYQEDTHNHEIAIAQNDKMINRLRKELAQAREEYFAQQAKEAA